MAPQTPLPLSPAELAYLHASLAQSPPIRPDGRAPTQFRPLVAETDILPSANGSARVSFADGSEAVVGVKAEVVRRTIQPQQASTTKTTTGLGRESRISVAKDGADGDAPVNDNIPGAAEDYLNLTLSIPSLRDDDSLPASLCALLSEPLTADSWLPTRLTLSPNFHWRLNVDMLLLSSPPLLANPLPLLSMAAHLALLSTRLPVLVSGRDDDPAFDDDWEAAERLYPREGARRPAVTLLVASVGVAGAGEGESGGADADTILFDPSREELAVADAVLAISVAPATAASGVAENDGGPLRVLSLRTLDPPARLTAAGVSTALESTTATGTRSAVWRAPRGGVKRSVVARMIKMVVQDGGVGREVLEGLAGV